MRILSHGIFNMVFSLAPWLRDFSIHMTLPFPRPPIYYIISTIPFTRRKPSLSSETTSY